MHQFGSMVLAADSYRRDLLADAVRVRPIPTSQDAKDAGVTSFARSAYAIGTMLIRAGPSRACLQTGNQSRMAARVSKAW